MYYVFILFCFGSVFCRCFHSTGLAGWGAFTMDAILALHEEPTHLVGWHEIWRAMNVVVSHSYSVTYLSSLILICRGNKARYKWMAGIAKLPKRQCNALCQIGCRNEGEEQRAYWFCWCNLSTEVTALAHQSHAHLVLTVLGTVLVGRSSRAIIFGGPIEIPYRYSKPSLHVDIFYC